EQTETGDRDACDLRVEVAQQLLQTEEVPRCLRRVRREARVRQLAERSVFEGREDDEECRHQDQGQELRRKKVRPDVDLIVLPLDGSLDAFGRNDGEQPVDLATAEAAASAAVAGCRATGCGSDARGPLLRRELLDHGRSRRWG